MYNKEPFTAVAPVTIVRLNFIMQLQLMQTSELFINFRDGEDFFELLGIIYTKLVAYHCQNER